MTAPRVGVLATGAYLPAQIRTNEEVETAVRVPRGWIRQRTGVLRRHVAAPEQAASDLAAQAVRRALDPIGLHATDLGLLVLATSTPDELGPSCACRVQHLLGASNAVAFDIGAACSGWLFGARVAHDWLRAETGTGVGGGGRYAAVVGVEVYSRFLSPADRTTAVLFGDGAAATVLGHVPDDTGFAAITLGSDGAMADDVLIPAGGSRLPACARTIADGLHRVRMDGRVVRDFILEIFPAAVADALARNGLDLNAIDLLVTHQPNPVLLRQAAEDLGIPPERVVVVGDLPGNIGAASIPLGLARAADDGRLQPGDRVLIVAFGAGATWGSTVLTWTAERTR
ncbi:3-oxoacyl-ACP synthase III family protein [Kitasatospora sp. NPDC059463]|uniref:3-oxoacyl-ACP synthase III family protein n=1 Tax=unclassified Kitasatospora TaxID=2633591 RepID=UPI0036C16077